MTMAPPPVQCDIAIIGGGIVGSCVAYFAKTITPDAEVCVIEPDPSYEYASSVRASGGCRVQFTGVENIDMSLFGIDFIRGFDAAMSTPQAPAHAEWVEGGYLLIVPPAQMKALEDAAVVQRSRGATVDVLSPSELKARFPSMQVDDLGGGAHTPHDGWCDPNGLLWGVRRKAASLGVAYVQDHVIGAQVSPFAVKSLRLAGGGTVTASAIVNAAGAWSGKVAKLMGMPLPVSPLKRYEHYFTAGSPIERLPYVKDYARLAFRSEGEGFSGGLVDDSIARGFDFDVDYAWFEDIVWPAVAHRFPAFEAARCHRTWAGLYEQSDLDGNPIIGRWNSKLANLYTVAGFSGHGMMHAPAAGRAIAELIAFGKYQTIDLARLGYERVEANAPYPETGIL
jgi:FAD-dependent oxidoreductase domain-containing protein 1